jgi:hypothetical protein
MSCGGKCDYKSYFSNQVGTGAPSFPIYRGAPYQKGFGFWGNLFTRYGVPVLSYLARKSWNTGENIARDVYERKVEPKVSVKRRLAEVGRTISVDALQKAASLISQSGSGRKRVKKRKVSKRKTVKKVKSGKRKTTTKRKRKQKRKKKSSTSSKSVRRKSSKRKVKPKRKIKRKKTTYNDIFN